MTMTQTIKDTRQIVKQTARDLPNKISEKSLDDADRVVSSL
jgi:hypothetical protein